MLRRIPSSAAFFFTLALTLASTSAMAVGTRHFVIESQADFKKGELSGVSVDSSGQLRAGFDLGSLEVSGADSSWDALPYEGGVLLATGNEGKLLFIKEGKIEERASLSAMAITSLELAFGDRVIVGALPGGKLYELKGKELVEFSTLEESAHVWDLAYDATKQALFAATGPDGKLFRVTADGTAQVYFDSDQPHLVSVASTDGRVLCGSSGKARLYALSAPGRVEVLYDFESTEVRAIASSREGSIFAIANELKSDPRDTLSKPGRPAGPQKGTAVKGKGVLFQFAPDGTPEKLFESEDETLVSLALDPEGQALVGTGGEGRIYRVGPDHQNVLVGDVEQRQVTRLLPQGAGQLSSGAQFSAQAHWVVTSDPVVLHTIVGQGGVDALWTSEVLDAGFRAAFGRIGFDADGKVALSTRTGNTKEPDDSWSDWSDDLTAPSMIKSPKGRYFQVRARMLDGKAGVLRRIEVPFVTDNLRPVLTEVAADSAAAPASQGQGRQKSGEPFDSEPKPQITVTFKVDNPDEDELRYYVDYQPEGSRQWFSALEPGEVLTRSELKWETSSLPEGRYRLRVTATDELSNPPDRVRKHSLTSGVVLVDNTAPRIVALKAQGGRISGSAVDGLGPIRRVEARIAGREEWIPLDPKDGVFDQAREDFSADLAAILPGEPAMVTVRVFDTAGNSEVAHLTLNPGRR